MKINKELAKGSTPLLVLSILSKEEMYGYQIIKTVEKKSGNVFSMKEGTLYPILHSLESGGYLQSYWTEVEGRGRKYYKITDKGLKQLEEKQKEWNEFSVAVNRVLGGASLAGSTV
ncbi:MAG: helix-turn-helix transcriptional regulator [Clostridia bacterium]|nr:helix-turn-helix transcriptional regulator [Clostridia bacterium]